ncbi:putative transcriptional regulator [Actinoplanes missouriensis 431]|uniref:Putative transcriptional regulator n=1 Tax=Actinoplanes missouriensis (strain ATCC 14538 / DSM 43046 / CBS 188.64 / JCM 3121 / NBRC 102363 / NCIMB 12654 / NRRL B-3342 / UNCC 431) TaxID=512565 RepID=I0HFI3_ACTM4|nr:winged helix-turn-helix domain-containing protein [Actinoplanes missouriensis]BAL91770.1 putative transcriptional regulator [Actinoplanes missouriensis 431]
MSALAVAHPHAAYPRPVLLRPLPPPAPEDEPVTVTISISGGADGRERILAALRELVDAAGPSAAVELEPVAPAPRADGGIQLDPRARTAFRAGRLLELSRLEYDLLLFLSRHPRQVFSRSQLLTHVWGHRHTTNRTVDVHVSRLRTKLDDPELITTVYGLGYRLADDAPITVVDR